jgi:hypothetical protein
MHWTRIEALAQELLKRDVISGKDAAAIIDGA